jgi:DNA-binding MurR/RpiR family transcriptional regulator
LLADGLQRLGRGDLAIILAYSRVYPELEAVLGRAATLGLATILVTDALGTTLRKRVDLVLPVERGRADGPSMHTATLALFEALLVGVAAKRPAETIANLKLLNDLRTRLAGKPMDLPMPEVGGRGGAMRKERKSRS